MIITMIDNDYHTKTYDKKNIWNYMTKQNSHLLYDKAIFCWFMIADI